MQSLTTNHRPAMADYRPSDKTVPAPAVRPHWTGGTDMEPEGQTGQSQEKTRSGRDRRRATGRTRRDDPGPTTILRGSLRFVDAVSQCSYLGCRSSSSSFPGPREQRPEICRLPIPFRVGSNSVDRLDCSTPVGNTTQASQFCRRADKDAVCIPSPRGSSLGPDPATCLAGRNNRAGRPTIFYSTPGISFWGPQPSGHCRKKNAGD